MTTSIVQAQGFKKFVTTSGYRLMDGDRQIRFISWNIPNLNYVEDMMAFDKTNPYALPTEYEMRDAFETVKEMGGQVIRIYTIPVKNSNFPEGAPTFVEAPGLFNEEAFKVNDMMLALANEYQIRIIFSFLNNWQWMGGVPNYAAFRGKKFKDFWVDPQLKEDFKKTIEYTINRKNTITGLKYKNDKAILCWETGNELNAPDEWTAEIAAYIKGLDKKHLLMDGYFAIDSRTVKESTLLNPNIDILSSHHYERNPLDMHKNIDRNLKIIAGRKPYLIGEFGFEGTEALASVLDKVIGNEEILGALTWSMRYHHRDGGFYHHSEPLGVGIYKAFHWPGFVSGSIFDEKDFLAMYVDKAYEIQGLEIPAFDPPKPPTLLPIDHVYAIKWQGVAGASGYNVERSKGQHGPWSQIGFNISDAKTEYFANYQDKTAEVGQTYYYRVRAVKSSGISTPSNIIGPVLVDHQAIIDNCENFGKLFHYHNVVPVTGEDRSFKEDKTRIQGDYGAELIYNAPGNFHDFNIYSFEGGTGWHLLSFSGSADGENWDNIDTQVEVYASSENNYGYSIPKKYTAKTNMSAFKYLKIKFYKKAQIARSEIIYK